LISQSRGLGDVYKRQLLEIRYKKKTAKRQSFNRFCLKNSIVLEVLIAS
jgi:hypothetical protein